MKVFQMEMVSVISGGGRGVVAAGCAAAGKTARPSASPQTNTVTKGAVMRMARQWRCHSGPSESSSRPTDRLPRLRLRIQLARDAVIIIVQPMWVTRRPTSGAGVLLRRCLRFEVRAVSVRSQRIVESHVRNSCVATVASCVSPVLTQALFCLPVLISVIL